MYAIFKKELSTYFKTVTGYVFLAFFIAITGYNFYRINLYSGYPYFNSALASTLIMLLILIPVLTMRLFAEETRQKTDQLLFTSPISIPQIVIGKFLAAATLFLIAILAISFCPFILSRFGTIPFAETIGGLVGYLLMGCCFISLGLFISVLTDNQIIAAVGTFAAMFFIFMIDAIASIAPVTTTASVVFICLILLAIAAILYNSTKNIYVSIIFAVIGFIVVAIIYHFNSLLFDGIIVKFFNWFSILSRYDNFSNGIFSVSDVVYYITFSIAFIYFTINTIEKRRWR